MKLIHKPNALMEVHLLCTFTKVLKKIKFSYFCLEEDFVKDKLFRRQLSNATKEAKLCWEVQLYGLISIQDKDIFQQIQPLVLLQIGQRPS